MPGVAAVFEKHNVITHMYGGGWFLTGFVGKFPFALVTRIWDSFLLEGWKVFFRVGLALLHFVQGEYGKMSIYQYFVVVWHYCTCKP